MAGNKPPVMVRAEQDAIAREAAGRFVAAGRDAVRLRGRFVAALSGGTTPRPLYELLSTAEWRVQVDWKKTHLFWSDERFVPADDPRSNYGMARDALLSRIDIPPANVHPMVTQTADAQQAAQMYEQTIQRVFGTREGGIPKFDLMLLGLGENGHTASLFPHSPLLHENERLVAAEFVKEAGNWRITMTVPLINAARSVMVLVSGSGKAAALREVLSGAFRPEDYPAQLVRPVNGEMVWIVDESAVKLLPERAA